MNTYQISLRWTKSDHVKVPKFELRTDGRKHKGLRATMEKKIAARILRREAFIVLSAIVSFYKGINNFCLQLVYYFYNQLC